MKINVLISATLLAAQGLALVAPKPEEMITAPISEVMGRSDVDTLEKRASINCNPNQPWSSCQAGVIRQGIDYLRGLSGSATSAPGPGNCHRVSCSYNSAIWWCNDNTFTKTTSWSDIALCAERVVNTCQKINGLNGFYVLGQRFTDNGWNCVVRSDSC